MIIVADVIITSVGFEARAASDRVGDVRTDEARAASDRAGDVRTDEIITSVRFEARAASDGVADRDVGASLRTARHSLPPMQRRHGVVRMRVAMPG